MKLELNVDSIEMVKEVATELLGNTDLVEKLAGAISEDIADNIDIYELTERVAADIDVSELAEHIGLREVANYLDLDDLATSISENTRIIDELAASLDEDKIIKAISLNFVETISDRVAEKIQANRAKHLDEIRKLILELGSKIVE